MRSAARQDDSEPARPSPGELADRAAGLIGQAEAVLTRFMHEPASDRLLDELVIIGIRASELTAVLQEGAAGAFAHDRVYEAGVAAGEARATERAAMAAVRRRRRGAHADPSQPALFPRPRLVPGIALAGAALKPLSAAVRHSWPAQHLAQAGAIAGTVATLATAAVVVPHAALTSPFGAGTSAAPNPAASIYSATPVITPSSLPVISAFTHPKANPDAAASRPLTLPPPPAVSPVQGPGDTQGPPSRPSSLPVPVPQVKLVVTGSLDLGLDSSGEIRLTAFGGSVSWSASSSVAGLSLDTSSGTLAPGEAAQIGVSLTADLQALAGPADVVITWGDGKSVDVPVSWAVIPLPVQVPDVVPSGAVPSIGA